MAQARLHLLRSVPSTSQGPVAAAAPRDEGHALLQVVGKDGEDATRARETCELRVQRPEGHAQGEAVALQQELHHTPISRRQGQQPPQQAGQGEQYDDAAQQLPRPATAGDGALRPTQHCEHVAGRAVGLHWGHAS